ncbi:MAG: acyltransferase [Verrucomicrobiales bacterium]|nr:MAG: acyltransferase [Verrucomicrobiales bacterium]
MTLSARIFHKFRKIHYRMMSDCQNIIGRPIVDQPTQFVGKGRVVFNGRVQLGYYPSPYYLSGYIYIEARHPDSVIEIEDGVIINNNTFLISDGPGIFIGKRTMIGTNCEILDSNFHDPHPDRRLQQDPTASRVVIGENVMIGSNVRILKGVKIGDNAIISNSTVVTRSIPANAVVYGNPAKAGLPLSTEG